jgi:hypothetical protein
LEQAFYSAKAGASTEEELPGGNVSDLVGGTPHLEHCTGQVAHEGTSLEMEIAKHDS